MNLYLPRARGEVLRLVAALLATSGCATLRPGTIGPTPFRVLVYNIRAGKDVAGADNLRRVAALVRTREADLVLLQEVDRGTERSGRVDQVAEFARLTGYHAAFGKTLDYQGGEYGIALLSRWPIADDTLIRLPVDPPQERAGRSHEPRGALYAKIATPRGTLHVLNTHLDPSADDRYRRQEMTALLQIADRLRANGDTVLFGGDFNATPESAVVGMTRAGGWNDAWSRCGSGPGYTYPARTPVKRIDYLVLPNTLRCDSAAVIASAASDHRPVLFVVAR